MIRPMTELSDETKEYLLDELTSLGLAIDAARNELDFLQDEQYRVAQMIEEYVTTYENIEEVLVENG